MVQALPKGDRGELAVDVLTEVGVDRIVPWAAARSVTQWRGDRGRQGAATSGGRTPREASKQSRRAWFSTVAPLASTRDVAALHRVAPRWPSSCTRQRLLPLLRRQSRPEGASFWSIGPEGGLTDEELEAFAVAGAVTWRMGPTVLRTSTAGVVAAAVVLAAGGRWA